MSTADSTRTTLTNFASDLENQTASLNTGVGLLLDELMFDQHNPDTVARAVSRLYFLAESLRDVGTRMENLTARAGAAAFGGEA